MDRTDPTGLYSPLTMFGGGDWIKGSDGLSAWDRDFGGMPSNRWQAGENGAGGGGDNGKGLTYRFDRYPEKGPGGRPVVERAMKRLARTPNGRAFQKVNRSVIIRPVDREHTMGSYVGAKTGNHYLYLDPTDSRFYDDVTFNRISHFKGETVPDSDEGRAAVIAHEFGHLLYDYGKDIDSEIRNVRENENPTRDQLQVYRRSSFAGNYFPNP